MTIPEVNPEIMHQPKGSMCATCKRQVSGCADIDFSQMKVVKKIGDLTIIKCSEWRKK
jgi:hypothetical protein